MNRINKCLYFLLALLFLISLSGISAQIQLLQNFNFNQKVFAQYEESQGFDGDSSNGPNSIQNQFDASYTPGDTTGTGNSQGVFSNPFGAPGGTGGTPGGAPPVDSGYPINTLYNPPVDSGYTNPPVDSGYPPTDAGYTAPPVDSGYSNLPADGGYGPPGRCKDVTANPTTLIPGQTSTVTANGCSNILTYFWSTNKGTINNQNNRAPTTIFTAPARVPAGSTTATITLTACGGGRCTAYQTTITINQGSYTVAGTVFTDTLGNQCSIGAITTYSSPNLSLINTSTFINTPATSQADGTYNIPGNPAGPYNLALSLPAGYSVENITGATLVSPNSATFQITNQNVPINWCISNNTSWFQTDFGDVRMNSISNPVPAGQNGATGE